jgi:hypothetical protein
MVGSLESVPDKRCSHRLRGKLHSLRQARDAEGCLGFRSEQSVFAARRSRTLHTGPLTGIVPRALFRAVSPRMRLVHSYRKAVIASTRIAHTQAAKFAIGRNSDSARIEKRFPDSFSTTRDPEIGWPLNSPPQGARLLCSSDLLRTNTASVAAMPFEYRRCGRTGLPSRERKLRKCPTYSRSSEAGSFGSPLATYADAVSRPELPASGM